MSSISIAAWRRKPNHPRYYITNGREPLGVVYERRGVFTSIDHCGRLVSASTSLRNAVDALTTRASS
jgi:hypothetical protein